MKVTWFGSTTLLFDDGTTQLLFDAHVTRPSIWQVLFGCIVTDEKLVDKLVEKYQMDRLHAIFISHTHHDHVMDLPAFANKCGAQVYGSSSVMNVARGGNVPEDQLILFHPNDTFEIGAFKITVLKSIHSKAKWYNNNLGKEIKRPVIQPARELVYKEGGSYDFLIEHNTKKILIRPSFNYLKGEFDQMNIDVLYMGIAGISMASEETKRIFFEETVDRVQPKLIIPIHWDNFFSRLDKPLTGVPGLVENTPEAMFQLQKYCSAHNIACCIQLPLTFVELS